MNLVTCVEEQLKTSLYVVMAWHCWAAKWVSLHCNKNKHRKKAILRKLAINEPKHLNEKLNICFLNCSWILYDDYSQFSPANFSLLTKFKLIMKFLEIIISVCKCIREKRFLINGFSNPLAVLWKPNVAEMIRQTPQDLPLKYAN